MWKLTSPTLRKSTLNFSNSWKAKTSVSQLYAEDIQLINAVEYVNWEDTHYQFVVCEGCGIIGCQSQGWVDIRKIEALAVIIPAFKMIHEASKIMEDEYLPPYFLLKKGAAYLNRDLYRHTLCQLANFPTFESLASLSAWEASKLFQFEAPNNILSDLLHPPTLLQDIILASSEGSHIEQTKELMSLIDKLRHQDQDITLRKIAENDRVIAFYLDISGFPQWKAMSHDGDRYSLYLEPGFIIEI